eukprot:SAG31_NODE_17670_length_662_cov_0.737123_1_plen_65_part_01
MAKFSTAVISIRESTSTCTIFSIYGVSAQALTADATAVYAGTAVHFTVDSCILSCIYETAVPFYR